MPPPCGGCRIHVSSVESSVAYRLGSMRTFIVFAHDYLVDIFKQYLPLSGSQLGVEKFYERGHDFVMVCRENKELVDRINARFGPVIVYKQVSTVAFYDRLALMSVADVFVNTCVRCGLNLRPFEYIFCSGKERQANTTMFPHSEATFGQ